MGDDKAAVLASLYSKYSQALRKYIARLVRDREEADDLAQEVFVRLSRREDVAGIEHPRAFLHSIALNLINDKWRSDRVRHFYTAANTADIRATSVDQMDPERIALARETVRILDDAVRALPPKCRRIVIMHKFQHMSYAEISRETGLTDRAIEKHIMRGMARIELHLQRSFRNSAEGRGFMESL
jgi:RNA polymerase sigma-70 factor (ECF subfamily)